MNQTLVDFARTNLKEGLAQCTPKQVMLFKRMYSPYNLDATIEDVVDKMPIGKLDWAMLQVERTLVANA